MRLGLCDWAYAMGKGKDHKRYEYGNKVSIISAKETVQKTQRSSFLTPLAPLIRGELSGKSPLSGGFRGLGFPPAQPNEVSCTASKDSNIIVGVVSHKKNQHDAKTLPDAIKQANSNRTKPIEQAVCDRGYCGVKQVGDTAIILPSKALKKDNRYQRDKKRKLCKRRAAIEPIIGHLKSDFRLSRNRLKGQVGDAINALMAACAWNLRKWLVFCHVCYLWLKKARFCSFFGKKPLIYLVQG